MFVAHLFDQCFPPDETSGNEGTTRPPIPSLSRGQLTQTSSRDPREVTGEGSEAVRNVPGSWQNRFLDLWVGKKPSFLMFNSFHSHEFHIFPMVFAGFPIVVPGWFLEATNLRLDSLSEPLAGPQALRKLKLQSGIGMRNTDSVYMDVS